MVEKILYVRGSFAPINFKSYNVQEIGLGKAFCALGYDFDLIYLSKKKEAEWKHEINGHVLRVIPKRGFRLFRTRYNHEVLDSSFLEQYKYIISAEYGQIMTYALSRRVDNTAFYSGPYYNLFKLPFVSPIYDYLFTKKINKRCRAKFVKSILAKEYLEAKGYTNLTDVGVGLDTDRFNQRIPIQEETQKIVDFMTTNNCILYVGSLSNRKNFPFLIDVYVKLRSERKDVKFVVIGKGNPRYIKRYIARIPEQYRCDLLRIEKIDNSQLKYIYPLAKAFLLPSKQEIFGMVLLESMYLGAPVITSRNGGSTTLIEGRDTGTIISEFDVCKWVNAVEQYLDNPLDTAAMTQRAHQLIVNDFVWIAVAKKMLKTFDKNTYQEDRQ
jgi:glycosyltransferase involved in cell wall biosynthesis